MKLITFDDGRVGRLELEENLVIELDVPSTRTYFELEGKVAETGERLSYSDVRLRAPIVPKKFFHTAGNFAAHHEELEKVNWSHPVHKGIVFFQNVDAIIGPDDEIVYPDHLTREMDYELEMLAVIGKPGKFFSPEDAVEHIAGFTIFNDWSCRDLQRDEMAAGLGPAKGKDSATSLGPYVVTPDELTIKDGKLFANCVLKVNGEKWMENNASIAHHSWGAMIERASRDSRIVPGDVLGSGTVSGGTIGEAMRNGLPARWLKPGDVVEIDVEGIGVLRTKLTEPSINDPDYRFKSAVTL